MLNTRQKVLRNFWYATVPTDELNEGPNPFLLLGEDIVLFVADDGAPAALKDRCLHRTAKLSKGWIKGGRIVCGYHGWEYDGSGRLKRIRSFPRSRPRPTPASGPSTRRTGTARSGSALASRSSRFPICRRRTIGRSVASTSSTSAGTAPRSA